MTTAIYAGSFDPITNGHLDVIKRAASLFEKLTIAIYERPEKKGLLFSTEERVEMVKRSVAGIPNVFVESYNILTVEYAQKKGVKVMVRGLRMSSDFEYEFEMGMMNNKLAPQIELVCLMSSLKYQFLSSSLLKDVARLGGCLDDMVPDHVAVALRKKFEMAPCEAKSKKN